MHYINEDSFTTVRNIWQWEVFASVCVCCKRIEVKGCIDVFFFFKVEYTTTNLLKYLITYFNILIITPHHNSVFLFLILVTLTYIRF